MKNVLILGGYGNFGKRITENLSAIPNIRLWIAGRSLQKARDLVQQWPTEASATLSPMAIDIDHPNFAAQLQALKPDIVIHTGGPFQGQDYRVPQACIQAGSHYIDLADDRRFSCDIHTLNDLAQHHKVLVVSGASSVPGLSSAVIDHYRPQFSVINTIDIAIAPGNKAERGEATVRGILSYTGHPFPVFSQGQWQNAYGWMDPERRDFGEKLGLRWLANVDVPDLELFPARYSVKEAVRFQAGLELPALHLTLVAMGYLAKLGLVKNWAPLTRPIIKISYLFNRLGSDQGGMQVRIKGRDLQGKEKSVQWTLYADHGIGPYIPTLSAIILARKLLAGDTRITGAMPCLGLYTLSEFQPYAEKLGIYFREHIIG